MSTQYLDKAGLTYFWGKIKDYVDTHGGAGNIFIANYEVTPYSEIDTAYASGKAVFCERYGGDDDYSLLQLAEYDDYYGDYTFTSTLMYTGVDSTGPFIESVIVKSNNTWTYRKRDISVPRKMLYGVCSTTGSTAAKTVTLSNSIPFTLTTGASVYIKFSNTNSASVSSLTLNVNSTGAKSIKRYGTTNLAAAGNITAGMVCQFIYDGTNWLWVGHVDTNTTYTSGTADELAAGTVTSTRVWTPKILHDYIESGGGAGHVELTQAEYDALTPAEQTNGTVYFITDTDNAWVVETGNLAFNTSAASGVDRDLTTILTTLDWLNDVIV